jgi:hypothetical protein
MSIRTASKKDRMRVTESQATSSDTFLLTPNPTRSTESCATAVRLPS